MLTPMNFRKYIHFLIIITLFSNCGIRKKYDAYDLRKLNLDERVNFVAQKIDSFGGSDLGNFIYHLEKSNIKLNEYDKYLKLKLEKSIYPYDIYLLSSLLIKEKENKHFVQNILNAKIEKWDSGNWGNKFWNFIITEKLNVVKPFFYEFKNGVKKYDFDTFLNLKLKSGELGLNPLLFLNDRLIDYKKGNLNTFLKKYEIIQIDYIPKEESVGLFGKRGVDGKISVVTR